MINIILNGIFDFITYSVNVLLFPINQLIENHMPGLDSAMNYILNFLNYIGNLIPWAVSYFGLDQEILTLISAYLVFKVTLPLTIVPVKRVIKWWVALKL